VGRKDPQGTAQMFKTHNQNELSHNYESCTAVVQHSASYTPVFYSRSMSKRVTAQQDSKTMQKDEMKHLKHYCCDVGHTIA